MPMARDEANLLLMANLLNELSFFVFLKNHDDSILFYAVLYGK
jgi:hypothetical protein